MRTLLEVEGVITVEIGTVGDGVGVLVPKRADIVGRVEAEGVRVFTKTVQVRVIGQGGAQAEVLRLEDERGSRGVKEDFTRVAARDSKGEGIGFV